MARCFNKVILVGNLTRDPEEILLAQNGKKLVKATLAVNDTLSKKTFYFDINFWGPIGEVVRKYTKKGTKILVEGRLIQIRREQKDQNGNRIVNVKTEVVASDMLLLTPKSQEETSVQQNINQQYDVNTNKQADQFDLQSKEISYQPYTDEDSSDYLTTEGEFLDDELPENIDDQVSDYGELDILDESDSKNYDDIEDIDTDKKF